MKRKTGIARRVVRKDDEDDGCVNRQSQRNEALVLRQLHAKASVGRGSQTVGGGPPVLKQAETLPARIWPQNYVGPNVSHDVVCSWYVCQRTEHLAAGRRAWKKRCYLEVPEELVGPLVPLLVPPLIPSCVEPPGMAPMGSGCGAPLEGS